MIKILFLISLCAFVGHRYTKPVVIRGSIVCRLDGTVIIRNNDINLNFKISDEDFQHNAAKLCSPRGIAL